MAEKYLLAKRNELTWHYNYMAKYLDILKAEKEVEYENKQ